MNKVKFNYDRERLTVWIRKAVKLRLDKWLRAKALNKSQWVENHLAAFLDKEEKNG